LLNAVVRFQATPTAPTHAFPISSASLEASLDRDEAFFHETSSVSRKFSLQCARQSKRVLAVTRSFGRDSQAYENALRLQTVAAQVFYPVEIFFPRKVAPPSQDTEPFLS
jgi:hypothetical protein